MLDYRLPNNLTTEHFLEITFWDLLMTSYGLARCFLPLGCSLLSKLPLKVVGEGGSLEAARGSTTQFGFAIWFIIEIN